MTLRNIFLLLGLWCILSVAQAETLITNEVVSENAPSWLKRNRMEKVIRKIQTKLEWRIRRTPMSWYVSEADFSKAHGQRASTTAFTKSVGDQSSIHMGPTVNNSNFDEIFGHELVHVIVRQKYRESIPKWFEEGLANHLSGMKKVDYKWLTKQPPVDDVRGLAHPFAGDASRIHYRYVASQALAEMLERKCRLHQLIQLSVERKIEDYIKTYCKIPDLNVAFKEWVSSKAL